MILQSINLYDNISIIIQKNNFNNIQIIYKSKFDFNINLEHDIVYKSVKLFFDVSEIKNTGVLVKINKNIPVGAGLAGGSADGAGAIVGLNKIYNNFFTYQELVNLGAKIGCDVPFCISNYFFKNTAHAINTGTDLEFIKNNLKYYLVLIKPDMCIYTKQAYELFDKNNNFELKNINITKNFIRNNNLPELCKNLYNRFESLILCKNIIKQIKQDLLNLGALGSLMSGSGPTVYGIFENKYQAKICFKKLKSKYKNIFLCKSIN